MHRSKGLSLGSVLLVLAVLSTLLFGLAAAGLVQFQVFSAQFNRDAAARAGRSVVARGLVELRRNPQWKSDLSVSYSSSRGQAVGTLTFTPGDTPWSTNNLAAAQSQGWGGRTIPAEFIHLVGVGRCRGQEQVVEAWFHAPTYPWAIAAGGSVRLAGGARIAGLEQMPSPGQPVTELGPADLRSNGESVLLGKGSEVYGDVLTSGRLEVEPGVNLTVGPDAPVTPLEDSVWVHGEVKSGEGEPPIAAVNLTRFDPVALGLGHSTLQSDQYDEAYSVSDSKRRQGSVTFTSGLQMDGGLLFVDGDLTVRGGMTGTGLVVCTGRVTVEGAASLTSGSGVALVAGGAVALSGSGSGGSYFQGLVYTEGGFSADRVSLVGPLVSRGDAPVELESAQLLMPKEVPTAWGGGAGVAGGGPDPSETAVTFHDKYGDPATASDWHHAVVYQKHQDARGVYYEGTRFDKLPDGTVNPTPTQRKEHTNPDDYSLDPATTQELVGKPVTPEAGDPPPPPADPAAPAAGGVTLDANQFFRLQDRLRQVLLVEH